MSGAETRGERGSELRRRVDDYHAGLFQRHALACIAASIAGDDGAGVAHLLVARRRGAGDEGDHRLLHDFGVFGGRLFHGATDLADDDDGVGAGILVERFQRVARRGAEHRIAADADKGGLADAGARQIEADQRAEAAGARDDADAAGLEDAGHEGRHDADEGFAGRHQPRGIRPDDAGAGLGRRGVDRHDVLRRDVFGQHHQQFDAGLAGGNGGLTRHRRGDEHHGDIGAHLGGGFRGGSEYGNANMRLAGALGIDAGDHVGAIGDHLFGPERALLAGDAEHDDAILFANDHCAAFTAAWMASSMKS